jgi:hypothetical protein
VAKEQARASVPHFFAKPKVRPLPTELQIGNLLAARSPSEVRVLDRAAAAKAAVEPPRNHRRETDWEVIMVGSLHFVAKEGATAAGDRLGRAVRASIDAGGRSNPEITRPASANEHPPADER